MRARWWAADALALAVALVACTAPAPSASPSTGDAPGLALEDVEAEPVERAEESVAMAFDAARAAELVVAVPGDLDFGERALICVYLGERPTTGWRLDLDAATLVDGELRIEARENTPRGDGGQLERTYPADCALLNRAALPVGELAVRADDTLSDELIVSATLVVPAP